MDQKLSILLACLGLIVCLSMASCQADEQTEEATERPELQNPPEQDPFDDWKTNHYKVYARDESDAMSPGQTLQLLKSLRNLYQDRTDFGSKERMYRVSKLIEVSEISEHRCVVEYIHQIDSLIDRHFQYTVNVVPYLELWKERQLELCFELFEPGSAELLKLTKSISDFKKSKYYIKKRNNRIVAGLLNYIEENNGGKLMQIVLQEVGDDTHSKMASLVKRSAKTACWTLIGDDSTGLEFMERFADDQVAANWKKAKVYCDYLFGNLDQVVQEAEMAIDHQDQKDGCKISKIFKSLHK